MDGNYVRESDKIADQFMVPRAPPALKPSGPEAHVWETRREVSGMGRRGIVHALDLAHTCIAPPP